MKVVAILALMAIIACVVYLIIAWGSGELPRQISNLFHWFRRKNGEWRIKEVTRNNRTQIFLTKPGEPDLPFGEPINERLSAYEYQEALEERRVAAQERCDVKNRRLNP